MPVKKTPDITDIIGEKGEGRMEKGDDETMRRLDDEKMRRLDDEVIKQEAEDQNLTVLPSSCLPVLQPSGLPVSKNDFPAQWCTMFEHVFASVPTVYFSLKESLPKIENNIITVSVKNDIQKEHFEAKIREVLEFLRTHFDEHVEDIVVETNELLETKKIIYDVKDKLQNFKEQNADFEDFLQILELKIKD